jgi:hypothetical protein
MDLYWDMLRWVNLVVSPVVLVLLLMSPRCNLKNHSGHDGAIWLALVMGSLAIAVSSLEGIAQDNPGGVRILLQTAALALILTSALLERREYSGEEDTKEA